MKNQRIIAVHLLNDYSGSPHVFRQSLEALVKDKYAVELFTATPGGSGFLTNISGVRHHAIFYKWNTNKWITLMLFLWSQCALFFKLLFTIKKTDIVYINSLLPFGAAIAAKCKSCKVVYHLHETSIKPALLKKFLVLVANTTAHKGFFVSNDLKERIDFKQPASVVYNALPEAFIQKALSYIPSKETKKFTVLMLCSLKKYKGVFEFIECARRLPALQFNLMLNSTGLEIARFFKDEQMPQNLQLIPAQKHLHPYYEAADLVMNLSRPDQWIETFGMTVLEALYYKLPVIVPPVGGVAELVTEGKEGFLIDSRNMDMLCEKIALIATCPQLYQQLSVNAFKKAQFFTQSKFSQQVQLQFESLFVEETNIENSQAIQLSFFK